MNYIKICNENILDTWFIFILLVFSYLDFKLPEPYTKLSSLNEGMVRFKTIE